MLLKVGNFLLEVFINILTFLLYVIKLLKHAFSNIRYQNLFILSCYATLKVLEKEDSSQKPCQKLFEPNI